MSTPTPVIAAHLGDLVIYECVETILFLGYVLDNPAVR